MLTRCLALLALSLAACSKPSAPGSGCNGNGDCAPGQICDRGDCRTVCARHRDCESGACCNANVCSGTRSADCCDEDNPCASGVCNVAARTCESMAPPRVDSVDGTGTADPAAGHAAHRLERSLVIRGDNLLGSIVELTASGGAPMRLAACGGDDTNTAIEVQLPATIAAAAYTLTVSNQAGSCTTGVTFLQGEPGPQGEAGQAFSPTPDQLVAMINASSSTVSSARLAVGTTAGTVAAGDHVHDASSITGGTLDLARLAGAFPVGYGHSALRAYGTGEIGINQWVALPEKARLMKTEDDSLLLVTWSTNLRTGTCGGMSRTQMQVRMDGGAMPLDCWTNTHTNIGASGKNFHMPYAVMCVVPGVPAGLREFSTWLYGHDCNTSYVNWYSAQSLLLVQELPAGAISAYSTSGGAASTSQQTPQQAPGRRLTFDKRTGSSILRLTLSDTFRVGYFGNGWAGRFEIFMDGAPLPSKPCYAGKYDNGGAGNDHHNPTVVQCIAEGVSAGSHTLSVHYQAVTGGETYIGWERGYPLLMVEELDPATLAYVNGSAEIANVTAGSFQPLSGRSVSYTVPSGSPETLRITYSDTVRGSYFCDGGTVRVQIMMDGQPLPEPCSLGQHTAGGGGHDHHWPAHLVCVARNVAPGAHTFAAYFLTEACAGSAYFGWTRGQNLLLVEPL